MNWTQQEIDKLLQPRVKVIADYPNSPFGIGAIIEPDISPDYHSGLILSSENYPSIFRNLAWYEERDLNVLANEGLKVRHFYGGLLLDAELSKVLSFSNNKIDCNRPFNWRLKHYTPITDEEYNKNK